MSSRKRLRRKLLRANPEASLVVAMAGGGADGERLFRTLIEACRLLGAACVVLVVTPAPSAPLRSEHG